MSTLSNQPDPFKFHGLTDEGLKPIRIAAMFELFKPVLDVAEQPVGLKKYSAENPRYNDQLNKLINQKKSDK